MIEKIILIENADPVIFYGTNNANIHLIKDLFPKIKIIARGNAIKVIGEESEIACFEEIILSLEKYCAKHNSLSEEVIIDYVKGKKPAEARQNDLIIYGINGKPIIARTPNQKKLVKDFDTHDLLFAIGPAGSGKTYTAIALAVRALKNKEIRKIILIACQTCGVLNISTTLSQLCLIPASTAANFITMRLKVQSNNTRL